MKPECVDAASPRGAALALVLASVLLAGCGDNSVQRTLGILRQGPDEFKVLPTRPLEIPESNVLPAPDPNAPARVVSDPLAMARDALGVPKAGSATPSAAETALLDRLGAANPPVGIRETVEQDLKAQADEETLLVHDILGVTEARIRAASLLVTSEEVERLRALGVLASPPTRESIR